MSRSVTVSFSTVGGTGAGLGRSAAGHSLVVDRPRDTAGGAGLGLNGAELLAASLGGCFWNDLQAAAQDTAPGFRVEHLEARVELAGDPPRVVRARLAARLGGADEPTLAQLFETARDGSIIANSLRPAFHVIFERL